MVTRLPNASQQAASDAVVDRLDAAPGPGYLEIRTGAQPADADTAATGTLLVTIDFENPAFGAADASGTASALGVPLSGVAVAAGVAGWFRGYTSAGAPVFDGAVRAEADPDTGQELVLVNTNIAIDQTVTISALTYTQPASE